jgi:hypothetical protein
MGNEDYVDLIVTKEQHRELEAKKLDAVSRETLVKSVMGLRARDLFTVVKVLVSQVGKEKAKELLEEAQYATFHQRGKDAAVRAGNPKDIDGYVKANTLDLLGCIPSAPIPEVIERTEKKYLFRCTKCSQAESLLSFGAGDSGGLVEASHCSEDQETLEVVKYMCPHDTAWAKGFNPDMKFARTKFFLDGNDYCEFLAEVE